MKIIEPSVEVLRTGLETEFMSPEQFIEIVGRTCYKSEDKITDESAAKFVSGLIKRGHVAMIEHWNLIYKFADRYAYTIFKSSMDVVNEVRGVYPKIHITEDTVDNQKRYVVSGNMRAWGEYFDALMFNHDFIPVPAGRIIADYPIFFPEYQDTPNESVAYDLLTPISVSELTMFERGVHQQITVRFTCDRGVSHEIVRHRDASYAQESTRYCNYGLDKFGNEITVIAPSWCEQGTPVYANWKMGGILSEVAYFAMLEDNATPQEARSDLVNSLKTEVIKTAALNSWKHFFELRCAPGAHPDMKKSAEMAQFAIYRELGDDYA